IVFVMAYNFVWGEKEVYQFLNMMFWSLLAPLSAGICQIVTHTGWKDPVGIVRIYGTFAHPNAFAFYLIFFLGLTFWKYQFSHRRLLWLGLVIIQLICFLHTFSLTGHILLGILFIGILIKKEVSGKLLITIVAIVYILLLINTAPFQKRIEQLKHINLKARKGVIENKAKKDLTKGIGSEKNSIISRKVIKNKVKEDSFTWRIANWQELIFLWEKKPLVGYGLNSTILINPVKQWKDGQKGLGHLPHNDFIRYLVETGVVGFILYIGFVLIVGGTLFQQYRKSEDSQLRYLFYTLFVTFIAWQIGSLALNVIGVTAFLFCFWAITGVALKASKKAIK
ncbi:MAG: O-antigen ligase family protein, partial [Desulfobacterota bacterium]|nr:O-antigen ligase family protein [Thermodesulfobacteriota bacterium]